MIRYPRPLVPGDVIGVAPGWTQHDAIRHALGDLGVPVLADVDCGHVPPHLSLVNGAPARVEHTASGSVLTQTLA